MTNTTLKTALLGSGAAVALLATPAFAANSAPTSAKGNANTV